MGRTFVLKGMRPHFIESTAAERVWMRVVVGANIAIIAFCVVYLVREFEASGIGLLQALVSALIGYFVADLASGVVHWSIDTWFDEKSLGRAVRIAREHHTHPQVILGYPFLEHAALGSAGGVAMVGPMAVLTAFFVNPTAYSFMIVWAITAVCLLFGTSLHNLGHKRAKSPLLVALQRWGLVNSPAHHAAHHNNQVIRYCAVNGWANYPCDALGFWRGLESIVQGVTGCVPRENDLEWQRLFRETRKLIDPSSLPRR